jgi:hypothetical protein
MSDARPAFPDGHFYSPVVDMDEAKKDQHRIWSEKLDVLGVDFNESAHRSFLTETFPSLFGAYDYPEELPAGAPDHQFYTRNSQFSWLDSRTLFVMLRRFRPARMIEIGSGFSSLLTADVNCRHLGGVLHFTCVEPYPRPFLLAGVPGIARVVQQRVQDVPLREFEPLQAGDILFIDSSHVSKTGSDVNYIVFEILPRLRRGVIVHFHDIFLPAEYPRDWVIDERRSWNEQYLVRALLMRSSMLEVLFGCSFAFHRFPELVRQCLGGKLYGGGSLWLRITADPS